MALAFTVQDSWTEGGTAGKRRIVKRVRITGSGTGFTSFTAVQFGLRKVEESSHILSDQSGETGQIYLTTPSADGSLVYINDASSPTVDGGLPVAAAFTVNLSTGGWYITVKGY